MSGHPGRKSPVGRALGLGSAGTGSGHWWGQRLSAVALVPLTLWFAIALAGLPALDFVTVSPWLAGPGHALLVALLVLAITWHSSLGVQVVVEDYVHGHALKIVLLGLLQLVHIGLAVAGVFAVFSISAGSAA